MKYIFLFWLFMMAAGASMAQVDSTAKRDSIEITEKLILQGQHQKIIDSLIKLQLEKQLKEPQAAQGKNELEQKLKQLEEKEVRRREEEQNRLLHLKEIGESFAVYPFNDTLFYIHTGVGSFSAKDRADAAMQRIVALYEDDQFIKDSLQITVTDNSANILYKNAIVVSLNHLDAMWYNISLEALTSKYQEAIANAVLKEKQLNSLPNQLKRLGWASLTIAALFLIIYFINKFFNWLEYYLYKRRRSVFKGLTIKSLKLLTSAQHASFVMRFHNILRVAAIVVTLYFSLPVFFNVFPQTKPYTETLLGWVIGPAKQIVYSFVSFLPDLITIIVVYIFTRYLIRLVRYFATQVEKGNLEIPGFHKDFAKPTFGIIRFLLYIFMIIIIFPHLPGAESPAFKGVSVFLGVLISLGSSSSINNMMAGLIITYMRPFRIGDRVKIGDVTGDVIEKTLLVTKIRTIKNEVVTVPNSNVLAANAVNYSSEAEEKGLILHTKISMGYAVPWKTNEILLVKAALQTRMIEHIPTPFVFQLQFSDFYAVYQLNVYTKHPNEMDIIYSELHKNIRNVYEEAGIDLTNAHFAVLKDVPFSMSKKDNNIDSRQ